MAVVDGFSVPETSAEKANVYRKIAFRIMPLLMACYVAAYLDRINIGFAKLHMLNDLGFSESVYGLGAGLFFIGYLIFEVPSNLYMMRVGAKKTISRIMILWGIISACITPANPYLVELQAKFKTAAR